ncbi:MAG: SemiSWEET transporter [Chloroflexi bacterium]|nr:SemiSWEET transporter [Chloroflexota bacterium]
MAGNEILGFVGGALTSLSLVPQAWRLFRLKSAREISLPFSSLLLAGIACWLVYGISMGLMPVIVWNAVSLVLSFTMLIAKLKYGR